MNLLRCTTKSKNNVKNQIKIRGADIIGSPYINQLNKQQAMGRFNQTIDGVFTDLVEVGQIPSYDKFKLW